MLKNISRLELKIEGKDYHFACDMDSPLPSVKEALFQFQKYIGQIEDQIRVQQAQQAQKPEPDIKPEPVVKPENEVV